jgi:hypothetical protein
MRSTTISLLIGLIIMLAGCESNCPPDPLSNDDIAGFIDGTTGILFTTAEDREDVLSSLSASPHDETTWRMPIFDLEEQTVYLVFRIAEVESPYQYMDYAFDDYCFDNIFFELETELLDLVELNEGNLQDQFILACGDAVGKIGEKADEQARNVKGKENDALEKLKKNKKNKAKLKKDMAKAAKEKGGEAKAALNNGDEETAKKKAKELAEETKWKFDLHFDYDWCDDWKFKLDFGYTWSEEPVTPPALINEFTHQNIRYKVYKNAECGPGPPTMSFICYNYTPPDTLRPNVPPVWTTQEYLTRDVCTGGNGFCVEQEVVYLLEKDYSDSTCRRLINVRQYKDFACFK